MVWSKEPEVPREDPRERVIRLLIENYTRKSQETLGFKPEQALDYATSLVEHVLKTIASKGRDAFETGNGELAIRHTEFMRPRLAAGLTNDDVRDYWNNPLVILECDEMLDKTHRTLVYNHDPAAYPTFQRIWPRYGDPGPWTAELLKNAGLTEADVVIYPEFKQRVTEWLKKGQSIASLIDHYGTLNAAIRHRISTREL